jgi:hypothetical protein
MRRLRGAVVGLVLGGKDVRVTVKISLPDWHDMMRVDRQIGELRAMGTEVTIELPGTAAGESEAEGLRARGSLARLPTVMAPPVCPKCGRPVPRFIQLRSPEHLASIRDGTWSCEACEEMENLCHQK